jgi:hypothetical protein
MKIKDIKFYVGAMTIFMGFIVLSSEIDTDHEKEKCFFSCFSPNHQLSKVLKKTYYVYKIYNNYVITIIKRDDYLYKYEANESDCILLYYDSLNNKICVGNIGDILKEENIFLKIFDEETFREYKENQGIMKQYKIEI